MVRATAPLSWAVHVHSPRCRERRVKSVCSSPVSLAAGEAPVPLVSGLFLFRAIPGGWQTHQGRCQQEACVGLDRTPRRSPPPGHPRLCGELVGPMVTRVHLVFRPTPPCLEHRADSISVCAWLQVLHGDVAPVSGRARTPQARAAETCLRGVWAWLRHGSFLELLPEAGAGARAELV